VQGDQVHRLFPPVYDARWKIKFAHRTFAWTSEAAAKERAVVHGVIIGFTRDAATAPRLFDYETLKGPPIELRPKTVNAYLVDGPEVWVTKRHAPLHAGLPDVAYGSKPTDGSHFLIEDEEELAQVLTDTVAAKYVRPFVGARELIHGEQRWCLWLVDLVPGDVTRSPVLRDRIAAVRDFRLASKAPSTRQYPHHHLFRQVAQPDVPYLCIPAHFSESRAYATVARLSPDVIAGNANFTCPDPDGFAFGIIESSMFLTWQKTVGGRIKSDPRFSKDYVWNNLPLPPVDEKTRKAIIAGGKQVEAARNLHPERSLAEHYNPLAMSRELVAAHHALDRVVDKAFGAGRTRMDELARQRVLFDRYLELTA
jgi:hypothetical protein